MKIIIAVLVLWSALQGCYLPRYAYSPSPNNVPVITEKKETKLGAYYSQNLSNHSRGLDLQAAVAVSSRWAVQGAYFYRREMNTGRTFEDSSTIKYKRLAFEAALGYYIPLNQEKNIWFQVFAGGGRGKTKIDDQTVDVNNNSVMRYYIANLNKLYIQPAFLFTFNGKISVALSSRITKIAFTNQHTNYTSENLVSYQLNLLHKSILFWEPALVQSFEFTVLPGVRFDYQLGFSARLNEVLISSRSFNFSAGIFLDIPKLIK